MLLGSGDDALSSIGSSGSQGPGGRMLRSPSRSQRPLASVHTEAGLLLHVFKGRVRFSTVLGWECCM